MVLGKLSVSGRTTVWITVGQGPTALTVGADEGCSNIFSLVYLFPLLSPSLSGRQPDTDLYTVSKSRLT